MIEFVWLVSAVLALAALSDRRAWSLLSVVAFVAVMGVIRDASISDRMIQVAMKIPFDAFGCWLAIHAITSKSKAWEFVVPASFCAALVAHSAYWLSYFNGLDIWYIYAHTLNALWLGCLASLCWPAGGRLIGIATSWARHIVDGQRGFFGNADEEASQAPRRNQDPYVRPGRDVFIPASERI